MKYVNHSYLTYVGCCLILPVRKTWNTWTEEGSLKNVLNVASGHEGSINNWTCDPYSILKSLLSCFATKETVAHPSIWKQEQKVMCSGGGWCYCNAHMSLSKNGKPDLFWWIPIHAFKFGKICKITETLRQNDYIYLTHSWFYCAWFISLCYSQYLSNL